MIEFEPMPKLVFDVQETMAYLNLPSERSVESLIAARRLTPLRICKPNRFARTELDQFVARELRAERRLRGSDDGEVS